MPLLLRSVYCGVLCPMITTLGIRGYLYGLRDVNVLRIDSPFGFGGFFGCTIQIDKNVSNWVTVETEERGMYCLFGKRVVRGVMLNTETSPIVS